MISYTASSTHTHTHQPADTADSSPPHTHRHRHRHTPCTHAHPLSTDARSKLCSQRSLQGRRIIFAHPPEKPCRFVANVLPMRLWSGAKEAFEAGREPGQISLAALAKQFGRVRIRHGARCRQTDRQTARQTDRQTAVSTPQARPISTQEHRQAAMRDALASSGLPHSRRFPEPAHVPTKPKKRQVITWIGWLAENTRQISEPHPFDSAYIPRPGRIGLSSLMS